MSKLWKQEWKYHIIFTVITAVVLLLVCQSNLVEEYGFMFGWGEEEPLQLWMVLEQSNGIMNSIIYYFFGSVITIVFIILLIKKTFIYWIEQARCGREFLQSLPIRKINRVQFHFLMDLMQIVVPVVICGTYEYLQTNAFLKDTAQLNIPWLWEALCGMMITIISYMIMLLGVLYLMESILVSGSMKIVGFIGTCVMTRISLSCLFNQLYENKLMQNIMGFFTMESVGSARYDLVAATGLYYGDTYSWEYGAHFAWFHEHMDPPLQYMGEWIDYASMDNTAHQFQVWLNGLNRSFAFSNLSSYIFYVICYASIGLLLIGLVMWLTDKKELSKDGFYFDFGRYLMSGMIALTVFLMITDWYGKVWMIILNLAASIIIFVLVLYLLDSDRHNFFTRQVNVRKNEVKAS